MLRVKYFVLTLCLFFYLSVFAQSENSVNGYVYEPGSHELFLMPTANTMDSGAYFSSYEIIFLNFTFSAGSRTHIGGFFLFPITAEFIESFTLGVKHNFFRTKEFQSAVWGSLTFKNQLYSIGNVFSYSKPKTSFHIAFAFMGDLAEGGNSFLIMGGINQKLSGKLSGIIEYTNAKELMEHKFNGIISIGIRFRGENTAWELAGIRPLEETSGNFLFFPFLKATFYF